MKPKIKRQWLAALRSGDYRKTTGVLKRFFKTVQPRYCCLGVLCETVKNDIPRAGVLIKLKDNDCYGVAHGRGQSVKAMLDDEMKGHTGVTQEQQMKLATMNDNGMSFDRIANYIEKHL